MDNNAPCTVVLLGKMKPGAPEMPEFQEYMSRSAANSEAHGGKLIAQYQFAENLGHGATPDMMFVGEYASREIAESVFTNDEYMSIKPLRDAAFEEVKILICA
ncbi:MAG: DUF1330 domain-containing protein [Thalassovita sp.]